VLVLLELDVVSPPLVDAVSFPSLSRPRIWAHPTADAAAAKIR
jgi:hypothetical protein